MATPDSAILHGSCEHIRAGIQTRREKNVRVTFDCAYYNIWTIEASLRSPYDIEVLFTSRCTITFYIETVFFGCTVRRG